jgi:hypothetical protein
MKKATIYAIIMCLMLIFADIALSQIPRIKIPGLSEKLASLIRKEPVITTSIEDAKYEEKSMDNLNPTSFIPMNHMPRTENGGFLLLDGVYELDVQSYCLRAGTHAPRAGGPGYIYAPLKGEKDDIVLHILQRSWSHPEVSQEDIQCLIWGIIARTDLKEMPEAEQKAAEILLSKDECKALSEGVIGEVSEEVFERIIEDLPGPIQKVLEAERNIREKMTSGEDIAYEELEQHAILPGVEPSELLVREIPSGRWSKHPDGYFVRFFPEGYPHTRIEIYVPKSALKTGNPHTQLAYADPPQYVAIPGNTGAQRLGLSSRKAKDIDNEIGKTRKATNVLSFLGAASPGTELPGAGVSYILDFNYRTWGESIKALAGDPPRDDYDQYEIPVFYDYSAYCAELLAGVPEGQKSAIRQLLDPVAKVTGYLRAIIVTQDRLGGALKANDMYWASAQGLVLVYYKQRAGIEMVSIFKHYETLLDIMYQAGKSYDNIYVTADMARAYQSQLRTTGFPEKEQRLAQEIGVTNAELEDMKQEYLALDPGDIEEHYIYALDEFRDSLKQLGMQWVKLPEVDPYWLE